MERSEPSGHVVVMRPRENEFLGRVRKLASNTQNIKWSAHARDRMVERDIPIRVALNVIREGYIRGSIEPGERPGEWKAKIARNVKGRRDVGVVVILVRDSSVFVKTVEWEDLK